MTAFDAIMCLSNEIDHSNEKPMRSTQFPVVLFIKLHRVILTFEPMVLFIQYVVLNFESVHEILRCDHSNETSSAVLSHGTICFVGSSNF